MFIGLGLLALAIQVVIGLLSFAFTGGDAFFFNVEFLYFVLVGLAVTVPFVFVLWVAMDLVKGESALRVKRSEWKGKVVGGAIVCIDLIGMGFTAKQLIELFIS